MSGEKKSKVRENLDNVFAALALTLGFLVVLMLIFQVGIALFGDWFEADEIILKNTDKAQVDIRNALFLVYNDFGRLEVCRDYSVRAYIPKKNYMSVPYPDRNAAISLVGKAWCENKKIHLWHMPIVVLRDIQTAERLDSYHCLSVFVSKK
jgi:hypothetical protein